ncbi:MAG: DUF885 domain-containing protein [Sinobacteraceae bacterium]|nr:DUF885 domain-containing protein [Nevskiaceae bacterium]
MKLELICGRPAVNARIAIAFLIVLSWTGAQGEERKSFNEFAEQLAAEWMHADPIAATSQQYFTGAEQAALDRQLTAKDFAYGIPLSKARRAAYVQRVNRALDQLKGYPRAALTPVDRASAVALEWQLRDALRVAKLEDRRYVFEQFGGLHVSLVNFLSQVHPMRTPADVDSYLARLKQLAPVLDEGVAEARSRARQGVVPPKFILQATIDGLNRLLTPQPADNVLVTSLVERAGKITGMTDAQRATAKETATQVVRDSIVPALGRVRALLTEQLPTSTDEAGIRNLPNGSSPYAVFLESNTTTDMTPEQVHALGLQQVARLESEMDKLLRDLGYAQGSVQERYDALEASVQPPPEPDPRPALLAEHERILRDAEQRAAKLFDLRPQAKVRVLREPPFTEASAAAHYSAPAPDGSRPGTVWIPLPGPKFEILEMRTLTYHEGVPGHHFQVTLQQEATDLPPHRRKRVFGRLSAFAEGWALYAEALAAESGWYEGDPKGQLGQLASELFRARRLVVDTGLHAKHWTRQQAIDYGIRPSEVDRYVVFPGQACAYMIGELEIIAQRDKARKALGEHFSLPQFHDWLLRTGTVPLDVLKQVIDEDIAAAQRRP